MSSQETEIETLASKLELSTNGDTVPALVAADSSKKHDGEQVPSAADADDDEDEDDEAGDATGAAGGKLSCATACLSWLTSVCFLRET